MRTSPAIHLTQRFTTNQALWLKEYHSNRQCDSGTLLPTSPILNQGERVIANKITGHFVKPYKLHRVILLCHMADRST
jgi:hypothetical protein